LSAVRWRQPATQPWTTARVFTAGAIALVGTESGAVLGYCLADGSPAGSHRVGAAVRSIGGSAEVLYVGTTAGILSALEPLDACRAR
jgi:hypothetical protein